MKRSAQKIIWALCFILAFSFFLPTLASANSSFIPVPGALYANQNIILEGNAKINGDTFSFLNTEAFGSPNVNGNSYASGQINWAGNNNPYKKGVYPYTTIPSIDFDYLKQKASKTFLGNLNLTGKENLTGLVFVNGDVRVTNGSYNNLTIVATGSVTVLGNVTVNGAVIAAKEVKVSGNARVNDSIAPTVPLLNELQPVPISQPFLSQGTLSRTLLLFSPLAIFPTA